MRISEMHDNRNMNKAVEEIKINQHIILTIDFNMYKVVTIQLNP